MYSLSSVLEENQRGIGMNEYEIIYKMFQTVRTKTNIIPIIGVVLGSGLGNSISGLERCVEIPFEEIPFFPKATVKEHSGKLVFGFFANKPIVVMYGRVHYYEGYSMREVIRPIRLMKMLGIKTVFLTNSSGAISDSLEVGDIVLVNDHIASFVPNPLRGNNDIRFGTRFPDMSEIYDKELIDYIRKKVKMQFKEGVYLQTAGPSFESPAEIKMYRNSGADLVGMSTACEAIAAVHSGLKVICASFVSNKASGIADSKLSMKEVIDNSTINNERYCDFLNQAILAILEVAK